MDVSKSVDITLKAPINKENNSDKIQTWPFDIKDFSNKNNKLTIYRNNDYTYNTKTKKVEPKSETIVLGTVMLIKAL
ncbi:hypothetical protein [Mycoplasma phocimorsus]|uniref:hypothetical protein n=1 Tax=Mycoplasma phocimorsus TaxID=3045839 RepID=UPI0024BFF419|nr:hypothetical protein [Mycoplasma phocimorsus]MDJ1646895.1 hypothetical protein [Mycoplasma phocimorsus]